jgi:hypothetical protein
MQLANSPIETIPTATSQAMKVRFCTLFDWRYLTRGLVMLDSLSSFLRPGDEVIILAMDDLTKDTLAQYTRDQWRVVSVDDLGDAELTALRQTRPQKEFCWTCTPALSAWALRTGSEGDVVVYVDADLVFFGDPRVLLDELFDQYNILIHEHRYSPDCAHYEADSGRFNVGLVAFRASAEGRACAEHWRAQTIDRCELAPGYCGDQKYLDAWPSLFAGLRILENIGGGVAPWNVNQYEVEERGGRPLVNGRPVIFYHYHALQTLVEPGFGFVAVRPSVGYRFSRQVMDIFYRKYGKRLRQKEDDLARKDIAIDGDRVSHFIDVAVGLVVGRYVRVV